MRERKRGMLYKFFGRNVVYLFQLFYQNRSHSVAKSVSESDIWLDRSLNRNRISEKCILENTLRNLNLQN